MIRLFCLLFLIFSGSAWAANECRDRIDNDGDGWIDRADVACSSPRSKDETNCGDGVCEGGEICAADCAQSGVEPIEYSLEWQTVDGVDRPVRVRAVGYAPKPLVGRPRLVLIAPMNHTRCEDGEVRVNSDDYDCPDGFSEVPLAEGMLYLAERLAEGGAVAMSVDMNQLTWFAAGELSEVETVEQRTALLLEHVRLWAETPPVPVDLSRLSFIGHSIGGQVAALASTLVDAESVYLLAPTGSEIPAARFGVLLAACDEDPGTRSHPGLHIVDDAIDSRTFEIEQAYLPLANHAQFNAEARTNRSGCTVPQLNAEAQRQATADLVARWINGEPLTDTLAHLSSFDAQRNSVTPSFSGFSEVKSCHGQFCEPYIPEDINRLYYYQHDRTSWALAWDGPAVISIGQPTSLRVTVSIDDPRNEYGQPVVFGDHLIPWPVTDYADPCDWDGDSWVCYSWWASIPREVLHTVTSDGEIRLSGSGRVIISDIEETN
jgi:dienelactone hydrolase